MDDSHGFICSSSNHRTSTAEGLFKVGPDTRPQPTRVRQNPKIAPALSALPQRGCPRRQETKTANNWQNNHGDTCVDGNGWGGIKVVLSMIVVKMMMMLKVVVVTVIFVVLIVVVVGMMMMVVVKVMVDMMVKMAMVVVMMVVVAVMEVVVTIIQHTSFSYRFVAVFFLFLNILQNAVFPRSGRVDTAIWMHYMDDN